MSSPGSPTRIGIMGWSAYRVSGTGSVLRTLLQGLRDTPEVSFLVAFPPRGGPAELGFPLNSVTVGKAEEGILPWMETAYRVLSPQCRIIFYPDSIVLPRHPGGTGAVTLLHDVLPLTLPEYYLNPFKYRTEKRKFLSVIQNTDRIITISEYSRHMIRKKFRVAAGQIHLIYNGIDPSFHDPHLLDLPETGTRRGILYVGDLRRRKNVMSLVKAYLLLNKVVRKEHPLILAADGKERKVILKRFRNHPPPVFRSPLSREELKEVYLQSKVFVFPSLQEGFGLPVIEAQANGLPVICGDHTSLGEITRENNLPSALYAEVRDPHAIAEAITQLIEDPVSYREYQVNGFHNSLRFTAEKMINNYQIFFDNLSRELSKLNPGNR